MWSDILKTLFGPSKVPHKIQKLLQYRFAFAFILGYLLDYLMLVLFLSSELFEVTRPLHSVYVILQSTLSSLYVWAMMVLLQVGIAGYGLILCHAHYAYPRCYGTKMKRIIYEFPIHFSLLFSILSVAIATSWLYSSFVPDSVERHYHRILGCVFGVLYFKTQHGLTLQRFPLPIVRLGLLESIQQLWSPYWKISDREALKPTLLFSIIFWPYMENIFNGFKRIITNPGILFTGWILNTLILAKLHMTRELYGVIMQRQLPLCIDLRCRDTRKDICLQNLVEEWIKNLICPMEQQALNEKKPRYILSLSISDALDSTHLYGFRMLAARDFYAEMSGSLWTKLFAIEDMKNTSDFWEELRGVLHKIIKDFLDKMDSCLDTEPQAQICDLLKHQTGIRSLIQPKTKRPQRTCCCQMICQDLPPKIFCCCKPKPISIICSVRDKFRERFPPLSGHIFHSFSVLPNLYASLFEIDKLAKLNHVLQCGEPLVWILQGLVCICARSLNEDRCGIVQRDLSWVFDVLLQVDVRLIAAAEVPAQTKSENGKLCSSHKLLMLATNRCLFRMLKTFGPNLDFMLKNQTLLDELKRRMENLNVFQEIL